MEYNRQKNIMKKLLVVMCVIFGLTINVDAEPSKALCKDIIRQLKDYVCAKEGCDHSRYYSDTIPNIVIPDSLTFTNSYRKGTYYYIGYQWAYLFHDILSIGASEYLPFSLYQYYVKRLYYIYAWKFNENTTFFMAGRWNGKEWEYSRMIENPYYKVAFHHNNYDKRVEYKYMILDRVKGKYSFINF